MPQNVIQKLFQPSSRSKTFWIFIVIIIITLAASLIDFGGYYNKIIVKYDLPLPSTKVLPFRLGLDLQGGTQLVYQADVSAVSIKDRGSAVEGVRDVIERRINVFGVSEPNVQINKTAGGDYRIIVELAGIKDIKQAIKMIGETPLLEFKEANTEVKKLTAEEQKQLTDYNKLAEKRAEEVLGKVISGGDFSALAKQYSEDQNTRDNGGEMG